MHAHAQTDSMTSSPALFDSDLGGTLLPKMAQHINA